MDVTEVWLEAELGMLDEEAVRADDGCGREEPGVAVPVVGMEEMRDLATGMEGRGPVGCGVIGREGLEGLGREAIPARAVCCPFAVVRTCTQLSLNLMFSDQVGPGGVVLAPPGSGCPCKGFRTVGRRVLLGLWRDPSMWAPQKAPEMDSHTASA